MSDDGALGFEALGTRRARMALERRAQRAMQGTASLEQAAQRYVEAVRAELGDAVALVRAFATVEYGALPQVHRAFVARLCAKQEERALLREDTLILTLMGSAGMEPAWGSPRSSEGHLGIPLLSSAFLGRIPMIAAMLTELGIELEGFDQPGDIIVGQTFGVHSGVFHVSDAATTVDDEGRKVIGAQDFVARYGIRSVFGVGGGYVGTPVYLTLIWFCREVVGAELAEACRTHVDRFKAETAAQVQAGRLFSTDP